jgi:hypothetical protein
MGCFVDTSAFPIIFSSRARVRKKRPARLKRTFSEACGFPYPCVMRFWAFPQPFIIHNTIARTSSRRLVCTWLE